MRMIFIGASEIGWWFLAWIDDAQDFIYQARHVRDVDHAVAVDVVGVALLLLHQVGNTKDVVDQKRHVGDAHHAVLVDIIVIGSCLAHDGHEGERQSKKQFLHNCK